MENTILDIKKVSNNRLKEIERMLESLVKKYDGIFLYGIKEFVKQI